MVVDAQSQAQSRDVKVGIQSGEQAQIVSGLKAGEVVVTVGAYGLPDKTKVKIEKPESPANSESAKQDKDDEASAGQDNANKAKPGASDAGKAKGKKD